MNWNPFSGLDPFGLVMPIGNPLPVPSASPGYTWSPWTPPQPARSGRWGVAPGTGWTPASEFETVTHVDKPNDVGEYLSALQRPGSTAATGPAAPDPLDTEWDRLIALQLQKYGGYDMPTALDMVAKRNVSK